jgi:trk/ktr system potassium uptake protein
VGAAENYAFFEPWTKLLLTFFMVLGRLELYTILVLFVPRFWRTT